VSCRIEEEEELRVLLIDPCRRRLLLPWPLWSVSPPHPSSVYLPSVTPAVCVVLNCAVSKIVCI
jgi:hypothetical protein